KKRSSRFVAFAAIIGLGLGAMFTSTASAVMDTDPVIEVDGYCDLPGPDSSSGLWMTITNDDSWEEDYVIGVFEGLYEDGDMPVDIVEITLEAGETEDGPLVVDSFVATVQVIDLSGAEEFVLVYDEVHIVCMPDIPDFDDEDDEESDDGPDLDMDIEVLPRDPGFEIDDSDSGIDLPDIDFSGEADEGEEPVIEEGTSDDEGEEPVIEEGTSDDEGEDSDEGFDSLGPLCGILGCGDVDPDETAAQARAAAEAAAEAAAQAAEETNEGDTPVIEEIGKPAKPKVDPEDPKDTGDSDEAASSEENETKGSSGLSLLWIILIIVAGLTTVGATTRKLHKNNS
ncbi:MAG: hypothetical protein CL470_05245, partial [Acidimicrobiaceae bacterium]|nr:hypothetical protein [Acidimicrobiaceae bacterium]